MRRALAIGFAALATAAFISGPANAKPKGDDVGPQAFGQPVINEVASRGLTGPSEAYLEILNPSNSTAVDLSNWEVRIHNAACQAIETVVVPEGTVLQPFGSNSANDSIWSIGSQAFTGGAVDQVVDVDIPDSFGVALYKFNPGTATFTKMDAVATTSGCSQALEGQALTPQPASLDLLSPAHARDIMGSDLNNNRLDFKLQTVSPDALN